VIPISFLPQVSVGLEVVWKGKLFVFIFQLTSSVGGSSTAECFCLVDFDRQVRQHWPRIFVGDKSTKSISHHGGALISIYIIYGTNYQLDQSKSSTQHIESCCETGICLVFKGPVHRTEKKTETGLNRTD
jgi:hypothetical protein